jgi:hypothetical protein
MSIVFAIFFASAMIVRIGGFPIDRDKIEALSDLRLVGLE